MTSPIAKIGSIWSVPQLGGDVYCLVLTDQRRVVSGRPEYRVMPLERRTREELHADQFRISAEQTSGRENYVGELYNIRSIPEHALGEPLALILDSNLIDAVRDAFREYSSGKPPDISWVSRFHRRREIDRWQRVTGQLDSAFVGSRSTGWTFAHAEITALLRDLLAKDWAEVGHDELDLLLPAEHLISWGGQAATIQLRVSLPGPIYPQHTQLIPRRVSVVGLEQSGKLQDFRSALSYGQLPEIAVAV